MIINMVQINQRLYDLFHSASKRRTTMQAYLITSFDDEAAVLALILQKAGFAVSTTKSVSSLTTTWPEFALDFILIALADESESFIKEIKQLRLHTAVPIVLITSSKDESLQVDFLDAGIDCLVTRPFGVRSLLAQIKALMRRTEGTALFNQPSLTQADVVLDPSQRTVKVGDRDQVRLTHLEFRLLHTLISNPDHIIPTENLVEYVWGYSGEGDRDLVRGLVQRLRIKVEPDPRNPRYIINSPGIGYVFQRNP
jgi:DNA-binding response OmpR family regulator